MAKKINYSYGTGRRRIASARVRVFKGKGESLVNDKPIEKYFPGETNKSFYLRPLILTETQEKYYFTAKIAGGGIKGQLDALVHGISRALSKTDPKKFRAALKKAGLLTRDARIRQRRMIGTGGKSRREKQSPKR